MSEGNGERQWQEEMRLRLEALEKAHRELEDSFIVLTHVETRMSQIVRLQAEATADHERRIAENERRMTESEILWKRIDTALAEATEKINFIIDREMRREGGPESR